MAIPTVSQFSPQYLELRIKGAKKGESDRAELLSASEAKILAYTLMIEAERLSAAARIPRKPKPSN